MVQLIVIFIAVLFFIQVIYYSSKNKLQDAQALLWLVLSIVSLLIAVFLPMLDTVTRNLGIKHFPSLVFSFGFLVVVIILIYQTTVISKQQSNMQTMAQEMSYLKQELLKIKNDVKK